MDAVFLTTAKQKILARVAELKRANEATTEDRATVVLDQQSVGRLSRMDALQQQAMSNANQSLRNTEIAALDAAVKRIESGEYGFCIDCGDDIEVERLRKMPTSLKCLDCMRG